MKKNLKKLVLSRETLYALEEGALRGAAGAATLNTCGSPCTTGCTVYPCSGPSDLCSAAARCTK